MIYIKILGVGILIYLIWALYHHRKDKSLTFAVFVEYLLIALLSFILLSGVIF